MAMPHADVSAPRFSRLLEKRDLPVDDKPTAFNADRGRLLNAELLPGGQQRLQHGAGDRTTPYADRAVASSR
ncbi:hypothetical protein [Streptomyces sp. NPDC007905]|uniref:hypothetical protein n=1 Tax=Streptomyces sp. NPDC007905 TaxID=3364788 RepID=UPI0036ECF087